MGYVPSVRGIDLMIRNRIHIPGVSTKTSLKMVTFSKMASFQSSFKQFFSYFLIRCTCQWNGIVRPLLPSKQVQSCPINFTCSAVLVIHGDYKLLKDIEGCIFYDDKIGLTPGQTSHACLISTMAAILKTGGRYVQFDTTEFFHSECIHSF